MSQDALAEAIRLYDRFTHGDGAGMDRRAFMAELTRIAGGAAAATALLSSVAARAQARPRVAPDDRRLTVRDIEWEARPGRRYRGYNAAPRAGGEDLPVVIVIHENRGLNDHIRDVARRAALAGYSAVAVDWLSPAGGTPADEDEARRMIGALDMAETVADGAAMIRWLASPAGGSRRVGIVGFCWGGGMVNRLAVASGDALKAAVSFYGPAPSPAEAARVEAPLLIHLAERDERVNATALPWVAALRNAGKDVRAINHHSVDHAFHNDTSAARYNRDAAEAAWAATLDFFRTHLRRRA
jgi:carboxymethylenebutenolidase